MEIGNASYLRVACRCLFRSLATVHISRVCWNVPWAKGTSHRLRSSSQLTVPEYYGKVHIIGHEVNALSGLIL
jgi:hypothetical protein